MSEVRGISTQSPHRLEYLEPLARRMSGTGLARLASVMVSASFLALALVIGIVLRTAALSRVPAGFNQDEACNGYDAYSLMQTGRDQHGNRLPITIQAFNDYRMPLFDYSLMVPVALFGLRPAAIRLGAALWGISDLLGIAVLAALLIGLRGAALAVALMALSPWHLPLSRFGHEAITASPTTTLAIGCFFAGIRLGSGRWMLVSGLIFGLSLYSYAITKAFVPPIILWLAIVYWRDVMRLKGHALCALAVVLACAVPQSWMLWKHHAQMMARFRSLSVFNTPWPGSLWLMLKGWLANFNPHFLFVAGSPDILLHPPGYGQLLAAQAAMLFLALCALREASYRRLVIFLLGWLAIAALPAAIILPPGHPLHSLLMVAPWTMLSATGMVFLFDLTEASRLARLVVASAILIMMLAQGAGFVSSYFRKYPALAAAQFQYGLGEAVRRAAGFGDGPVVVSSRSNQPYIYVLFFTKYPPERFQHGDLMQAPILFAPVAQFDRYRFEDPALAYLTLRHGVFVFAGWEFTPANPLFTIREPDGTPAWQIVIK